MNTKNFKYETYKSWKELVLILEYYSLTHPELLPVYNEQAQKFERSKNFQNCTEEFPLSVLSLDFTDSIYKHIYYKWMETEIYAFKFLQHARSMGGTYGHRIGPIWSVLKQDLQNSLEVLKKLDSEYTRE